MLRSLYSAVSGIKGHQTYLDVTGNNIANVNTVGFKKDSLLFADTIYQTMKSASAPNSGIPIGGVNPAQVGLGVSVAAIETIHSQGSMQNTGQETDMAINGKGFFVVRNGSQQLYTRSGAFALDKNGNLVQQGSGYLVQGYAFKDKLNPATGNVERVKDTSLTSINIPIGEKIPAKETQLVSFRCNLCSSEGAEITNLNNIPGGTEKVLRPHEYTAYGSPKEVTGVGTTAPAAPTNGDLWLDTTNANAPVLKQYDLATTAWVVADEPLNAETIYHDNSSYSTGNGTYNGIVAKRVTVDTAGATLPTIDQADSTTYRKPGETFLNTATGVIHTANATGTAWLTTTTDAVAGTAYAAKDDGNAVGTDIYVRGAALPMTETASANILDPENSYNIFQWSTTDDSWTNVNLLNTTTGLFATSESVTTQANIDAFGESMLKSNDHVVKMTIYDSLGNPRTMEVAFRRVVTNTASTDPAKAAETEWDWYAYYTDEKGNVLEQYGEGAGTLVFGDDGLLKRTYYYEPTPATPDPLATGTTQPEYTWQVVEKEIGNPQHEDRSTGVMVADFNTSGAEGSVVGDPARYESNTITLDFLGKQYADLMGLDHDTIDGVTSFASSTTTIGRYQDGYAMGTLTGFSVGQDGTVTGIYSNQVTLPVAQVALATFANDQGLEKVGGTCFAESANSGTAQIGAPLTGSAGAVMSNNLEMSNVDLSEEFVSLIRAQRGFQANSRVVTTSDQVLEELINLKR